MTIAAGVAASSRSATATQSSGTVQSSLVMRTASWRAARRPAFSARPMPRCGDATRRAPIAEKRATTSAVAPSALWSTTTMSPAGGRQRASDASAASSCAGRPMVGMIVEASIAVPRTPLPSAGRAEGPRI